MAKLKAEDIRYECKTHWSRLDPYSDLEETKSDSEDGNASHRRITYSGVHFDVIGGHTLRKHKKSYSTTRNRHTSSTHTFYRDMCTEPSKRTVQKHVKEKFKPKRSPSRHRKAAQKSIEIKNKRRKNGLDVKDRLICSYPLFQPIRAEDRLDVLGETDDRNDSDSTVIYNTEDYKSLVELTSVVSPTPKPHPGNLHTKSFGLKKVLKEGKEIITVQNATCVSKNAFN